MYQVYISNTPGYLKKKKKENEGKNFKYNF